MSVQKTYPVAILPCTEYYFAADRVNNLTQDWELVLEDTRPVGGCNAAEEMKKAGLAINAMSDPVIMIASPVTRGCSMTGALLEVSHLRVEIPTRRGTLICDR